jgi:GNAT superfamily N-acetyltransferase
MPASRPTFPAIAEGVAVHVRSADESELDALAKLWFDAWRDGHAAVVPAELTRRRTLAEFRKRLAALLPLVRAVGPLGAPLGFSIVKDDELYQLFVAAAARGAGVAAALIDDAEARVAAQGAETIWLNCAIGNERAARFYQKRGWHRAGAIVDRLETPEGPFSLEVWRYEKVLRRA